MSSVTINDLAWDYKHNTMQKELIESCDIEIVPRKMIEMIIKQCENDADAIKSDNYILGISNEANFIKRYAESLLKQFEEDDKQINVPNCIDELPFD